MLFEASRIWDAMINNLNMPKWKAMSIGAWRNYYTLGTPRNRSSGDGDPVETENYWTQSLAAITLQFSVEVYPIEVGGRRREWISRSLTMVGKKGGKRMVMELGDEGWLTEERQRRSPETRDESQTQKRCLIHGIVFIKIS
ncbi:hypothetical protein L6452_14622 [Arctium lappa]|uniref:Uncharacterized protein n=1 Tax=Arctium lappa TaxID=4217 RepID=A0ACB9CLD8_ARCLA|nr:hypothetical protein L6452_14622 [Arctium lappa]